MYIRIYLQSKYLIRYYIDTDVISNIIIVYFTCYYELQCFIALYFHHGR